MCTYTNFPLAVANGAAQGNAAAYAAGNAQQGSRAQRSSERGIEQGQGQVRAVEGRKKEIDHLGIEG